MKTKSPLPLDDGTCHHRARPTKSLGLYLQMAGRALRPFPGKEDALLLDHSGSVFLHGRVEDEREWFLDEDRKVRAFDQSGRRRSTSGAHRLRSGRDS